MAPKRQIIRFIRYWNMSSHSCLPHSEYVFFFIIYFKDIFYHCELQIFEMRTRKKNYNIRQYINWNMETSSIFSISTPWIKKNLSPRSNHHTSSFLQYYGIKLYQLLYIKCVYFVQSLDTFSLFCSKAQFPKSRF